VIKYPEHSTLLEAFLEANINHTHIYGGHARCSTCRVSIMEGIGNSNLRNDAEQQIADKLNFNKEIRLTCQSKIVDGMCMRRLVSDKLDLDIIFEQFSKDS
jgi:adenylate cyclase